MIQRTLFCIFAAIALVSSKNQSNVASSSDIVISSSDQSSLSIPSSSGIVISSSDQSSLSITSFSKHADPTTSVQSSATVHMDPSSIIVAPTKITVTPLKSTVAPTKITLASTISPIPSSPVSPLSAATTATPILSITSLIATSAVPSTAPVKSSSVIATPIPIVSVSPSAVPWPESINIKNNGVNCLQASLKAKFKITYKQKKKNGTFIANIPLNGKSPVVNGSCNETFANFKLTWNEEGNKDRLHTFSMQFKNNKTANKTFWNVQEIAATFNTSDSAFTDALNKSIVASSDRTSNFGKSADNQTYICNSGLNFKMESVEIIFEKIILQPFSDKTNLDKNGNHCSGDNNNDNDDDNTVPIAVGAALGGLVLIVLVAYIIGRRRSNRGYEQV